MVEPTTVDFRRKLLIKSEAEREPLPPRVPAQAPVSVMKPEHLPITEHDKCNPLRAEDDADYLYANATLMDCEILLVKAECAAVHIFGKLGHAVTLRVVVKAREELQAWQIRRLIDRFGLSKEREWTDQPFVYGPIALELRARLRQAMAVQFMRHNA